MDVTIAYAFHSILELLSTKQKGFTARVHIAHMCFRNILYNHHVNDGRIPN